MRYPSPGSRRAGTAELPPARRRARRSACLRRTTAAAAACIAAAVGAADVAAQKTLSALMRDTMLDNGLHVIVVPNPAVPLATIQVAIRNGAFTQLSEAEVGIPHVLEHMLFRGFGNDGFSTPAGRLNASYNGMTSHETVGYYITLPSSNLARGIQLMADLMRTSRFDQSGLQSEIRVVRGELERSAANPEFVFRTMMDQRLWGEAWSRKNIIGNALSISAVTPAVLRRTYDRFYVPNNASLVVTGDVSAADVFAHAARHFTRWKSGSDPFRDLALPPVPPLAANAQVIVPLDVNDVTLHIAWHGPSVRDDPTAAYAADLFAAIVNDRVSGFQERLVDSGLFQSVSMSYTTRAHVGPILLRATTTAEQLVEASAALRAELALIEQPGYVTPELLRIARRRLDVDWAMEIEAPSGLAWFVADLWSVAGGLDFVHGYLDAITTIDTDELELFVTKYLAGRPRVTGVLLSPRTRHELGPRLQTALAEWR